MSKDNEVIEKSKKTVEVLCQFLNSIIDTPELYASEPDVVHALKSQGRTCGFEYEFEVNSETNRTSALSLNTLKEYCEVELEGGFSEFEILRLGALKAIEDSRSEKVVRPNKRTKSGLELLVTELEGELLKQRQANIILLQSVSSAMSGIRSVRDASSEAIRRKRADDSLNTLRAVVSLSPVGFSSADEKQNVLEFSDYRDD